MMGWNDVGRARWLGGMVAVAWLAGCAGGVGTPVVPEPARAATKSAVVVDKKPATVDKQVDADLPLPPAPTRLGLTHATSQQVVRAGAPTEVFVRLRVHAHELQDVVRPPVNLALVVDTSGSMSGEPIVHAREAARLVLDQMRDGDTLSVVTFSSRAHVLVPSTELTPDNRVSIAESLATIDAAGTTDMLGGLQAGLAELGKGQRPEGISRIVLLGDGVPNDPEPLTAVADQAARSGAAITALGLGLDYDETLMNRIAQRSGGTFHFIERSSEVAAVFKEQVLRIQRVVARRGSLTINPGPGVTVRGALGLPVGRAGRTWQVPLGDMSEGQSRDVMLHLEVGSHRAGAQVELFDAVLGYEEAVDKRGGNRQVELFAATLATADAAQLADAADPAVEHQATRLRVADLIVQAVASARGGDLRAAQQTVLAAEKLARDGARRFDDEELRAKLTELRKLRVSLPSLLPPREVAGIGWGSGLGRTPAPAVQPAAALQVRRSHGDAVRTLQGM